MVRKIDRQNIFEDDEDYIKFIKTIQKNKEKSEFELYGYYIMGNHIHLLLREGKESLLELFATEKEIAKKELKKHMNQINKR
ncbi:transposase [Alkaliphilus metalliredigens]|nr:transposase [Alkaliphilus metalliredigens]